MRFLFIWPASGALGGVETLLARMSRWLIKEGHQVDLLVARGDNWIHTLPKEVHSIVLGERFCELYYYYHARRLWKSLGLPKPDVIKSFCLDSAWIAPQLAAIIGNGCKVITGMYGSFLFKWYHAPSVLGNCSAAKLYVDNYVHAIPAESRLVCGVDQIEELEEVFQEKCFLWPIPIDTAVFNKALRKPKWGKIVSVGRIDVLKQYNLYMVDVVQELIAKGHDVTWAVYGTGDRESIVRKRIEQAGLEGVISLHGTVPYQQFWEVLSDAYVFVGMGTAILEAALFKVPNVVALGHDRLGLTYGSVCQHPQGSITPSLAAPPTLKVIDEIERLLNLSPEQYRAEEERVQRQVLVHEIDASMQQFLLAVHEAKPVREQTGLYWANYARWLANRAMRLFRAEQIRDHPTAPLFGEAKAAC